MKKMGILVILAAATPGYTQAPDTLWTKTYGGADYDRAYSLKECESGGFILAGWTSSCGAGDADVY